MKCSGRNPNSRSDSDSATVLEQWEAASGKSRPKEGSGNQVSPSLRTSGVRRDMQICNVFRRLFNVGLIVLGVAVCGTSLSRMAWAEVFSGYPDIIVCQTPSWKIVVYVDRQDNDGVVWYRTMERQVSKIDKQGIFRRENAPDCDGKTVEQLRKEGKTFNITK